MKSRRTTFSLAVLPLAGLLVAPAIAFAHDEHGAKHQEINAEHQGGHEDLNAEHGAGAPWRCRVGLAFDEAFHRTTYGAWEELGAELVRFSPTRDGLLPPGDGLYLGIGSRALAADAVETLVCPYLSFTLLLGLSLNAALGWWWADPVAALLMTIFLVREGAEATREGLE